MKVVLRIMFLSISISLLLFFIQWLCTKRYFQTIQTNADATFLLELNPGNQGVGAILNCKGDRCFILTVAHLCDPSVAFNGVMKMIDSKRITQAEGWAKTQEYMSLTERKSFCHGLLVYDEGMKRVPMVPISIDYKKDLMLLEVKFSHEKPDIIVSSVSTVLPGKRIYTTIISPEEKIKAVLFSQAGIYAKFSLPTNQEDESQTYLQTEFSIGPGISGSPVFFEETNELMGVIRAELIDGNPLAPTKATFLTPIVDVQQFLKQSMKDENDNKSDRPHCYGQKYLCNVARGEMSFLDALGHFRY